MPIYCQKNADLNKKTALMPIFCQNNFYSLKNTVLSCHFFSAFSYKSPVMPIIDKKKSILSQPRFIMDQKDKKMSFFIIFDEEITTL